MSFVAKPLSEGRLASVPVALFAVLASLYSAVFFEMQYEFLFAPATGLLFGTASKMLYARLALLFVVTLLLFFLAYKHGARLLHAVFRWRYALAAAVLVLCVVFELSGSSVGYWSALTGSDSDTVFGTYRPIRSDEWLVFTPFAAAQGQAGFPLVSSIVRADETVMSMTYAQPAWGIATLFRPFFWGYLLLGTAKGLSFFWTARLLALFLVTFECARLLTGNNKYLAAALATAVSFAPVVEWWFAINGIAELFIFGQLIVLCFYKFLTSQGLRPRILFAALMAWFSGCYVLIIYPAWQVPMFYVFALMLVWVFVRNKGKRPVGKGAQQIVILLLAYVVLALVMVAVLFEGMDAIQATMGTVYPGARRETGGGGFDLLFNYGFALLLPVVDFTTSNQCEYAAFFSLFPLGTVLGIVASIKFKDLFSRIFLALQAFFLVYACVGFPDWLAQVTLMSNVTTKRTMLAIGFVELLLLVRFLYLYKQAASDCSSVDAPKGSLLQRIALPLLVIAVLAFGFVRCYANPNAKPAGLFFWMGLFAFVVCGTGLLLVLLSRGKHGNGASASGQQARAVCARGIPAVALLAVVLLIAGSGAFVNPVQKGTGALTSSPQALAVQETVQEDSDAKWIAVDNVYFGQFLIANGAPAINSVNVYPDLERWQKLDPQGTYNEVYNRYAHIEVRLQNNDGTWFEQAGADTFILHLNTADLRTLEVGYIYSPNDLSGYEADSFSLSTVCSGDGWYIYKVLYA